jgi:small multidrug resistance pump
MQYLYLLLAIIAEVVGTTTLKSSDGFTKFIPIVVVASSYGLSFYWLSLVLKFIPLGITYATWSGVGIVLVTISGAIFYKQIPDVPAFLGMLFIIAGVIIMNIFSKTIHN